MRVHCKKKYLSSNLSCFELHCKLLQENNSSEKYHETFYTEQTDVRSCWDLSHATNPNKFNVSFDTKKRTKGKKNVQNVI